MALEGELITRLLIATILGLTIGVEREFKDRFAGMRTHALVALGAAAFTSVSVFISTMPESVLARTDFARIASNIAVGIGFLGAGVIFKSEKKITGLTTAASLWTVAAIGMIAGFGLYKIAVTTTIIVLCLLLFVGLFERKYFKMHAKKFRNRD